MRFRYHFDCVFTSYTDATRAPEFPHCTGRLVLTVSEANPVCFQNVSEESSIQIEN